MKSLINRYLVLIIFLAVSLMGMTIRYLGGKESWFWDFWENIDSAFAVALGIMAFLAYKEFIKSEDEIKIYFNVDGVEIDTGLSLLRKDCTRGEILGILGMLQTETKTRFDISPKRVYALLKEVQEIQKGHKDKTVVDMTADEYEQFDLIL